VGEAISWLVELFRGLILPPQNTVQGLWAETLLIAESAEPWTLIDAWHVRDSDRFDFNLGSARLEVKSAGGGVRQHHFSLAQLAALENVSVIVCSVFVERAGGGTSLEDLLTRLRARLSGHSEALMRLEMVVSSTLGSSLLHGLRERFDLELAMSTLSYFDSRDVPSIAGELPNSISDVRFRVDLTSVPSIPPRDERLVSSTLFRVLPHIA
jgi:hypothetical protein